MPRQIALIVAVEEYQESKIESVRYAEADARDFSGILERHGYSQNYQVVLISNNATKTTIESKLQRLVESLFEDDTFVFFYAGHGFSANDQNYITAFDSQLGDLTRTSISLQSVFSALRKSVCKRVLMFLDSCESGLPVDDRARYIYTALSDRELEGFFRDSEYCVCFASCKTGQRSYSTRRLKHGIWTYHLLEALSGNAPRAIFREHYITAGSLQNYLSEAVPRTVRESFKDVHTQIPWVYGGKSREFMIADVGDLLREKSLTEEPIERVLGSVTFYGESSQYIKHLSGFCSSYFVPKEASSAASRFVKDVAIEEIRDEIDQIFRDLRKHFQYKARDINATVGNGDGKIICPAFDYRISVDLDPQDPSQALWQREVSNIRIPDDVLTEAFDSVFSGFDSVIFSFSERIKIKELIDRLEDARIKDLSVECPFDCSYCDISFEEHPWTIHVTEFNIAIRNPRCMKPSRLVAMFQDAQQALLPYYNMMPVFSAIND